MLKVAIDNVLLVVEEKEPLGSRLLNHTTPARNGKRIPYLFFT
jgi:hypothetical protein